jgi:hypothetical protein
MSGQAKGPHGHPTGFQRGCEKCEAAAKERRSSPQAKREAADRRTKDKATRAGRLIPLPTGTRSAPAAIGFNEAAVREQCEQSPKGSERPGTVAQAITLAKVLDTPELQTIHAQTSRQLHALLLSLDGLKKKSGGRLAAVQAMAGRGSTMPRRAL